MKKFLSVLFVMIFAVSVCLADEIDFSAMTDEELFRLVDSARIEMLSRLVKAENKTIIVDDEDIQIYITGKWEERYSGFNDGFRMEVVFVNKAEKSLGVQFSHIVINGWELSNNYLQFSQIGGGKKTKEEITFNYKEADLESYKEIEEVELSFYTFDDKWHTVKEYKEIKFDFNGSGWE